MWVKLKTNYHKEVNGTMKQYRPGDWLEVGKQQAMRLLADGQAFIPDLDISTFVGVGCGVVALGPLDGGVEALQNQWGVDVLISPAVPIQLPFYRTLLWDTRLPLTGLQMPAGFTLLETWQAAAPLHFYDTLALSLGDEAERTATAAVIRDLRVPVYNTMLLWLRRCEIVEELLTVWAAEYQEGGSRDLAFLRAVYRVKPLILPLPFHWATADGMDGYDG